MLRCLLLRMFHENLSLPCICGKQMKGEAMCYCTPKERFNYSEPACEDVLVQIPHKAIHDNPLWNLPASLKRWDVASICLLTRPVLTALVMLCNCLCMSSVVMCVCCLVNCLWCYTYNTYPGSLYFPQAPLYQSGYSCLSLRFFSVIDATALFQFCQLNLQNSDNKMDW